MCEIQWWYAVLALAILSITTPLSLQGHILAAQAIGDIYSWGKGVAIDYPRAMAAYKIAAEAGEALSQCEVGFMYYMGQGVAVDYKQARPWLEKAAAQDYPNAIGQLWQMHARGEAAAPSFRRARELFKRAIELGDSLSVKAMQNLTSNIQQVTSRRSNHSALSPSLVRDLALPYTPSHARRSPPSWTSGWRSMVRAVRT